MYQFILFAALSFLLPANLSSAPLTISFKQQKNGVVLSWSKVSGVQGYNLYRADSRYGVYHLLNASPVRKTTFSDNNGKFAYYKIAPVTNGREGELSDPQSFELELFGDYVYVFNPNDSREEVKQVIDAIAKEMANGRISQFTGKRAAFLFKPGNYDWLQFENGFYMHVAGLGKLPVDTQIDKVYVTTDWLGNKNATCNFWRAIENVSLLNRDGKMLIYGISQAAPMRRLMVHGDINLDMGGWSSGGFLANSVVTGMAGSPTQQQFFIRNNETKFKGVNWNLVSVGNKGDIEKRDNRSIIDATPVIYEKPFLFFENGDYFVFVPGRVENASGATWSNGKTENGRVIPLSDFYVARHDRDNAKTINAALANGKHILFTPGTYKVSETLEVKKANTVILGLGLATINPVNGNNGMFVADEEGIRIAGLIFDAGEGVNENTGTGGSEILLQVGPKGSKKDLSANPIVLSDLFFRVGGVDTPLPCKADISLEINANATIGDHFWIWRADHGGKVGWELNKADYGLIVNGDDVTIYGLFVEHYQKYDTYWKGENGRMYFYQNEKAYDVPTQEDWIGPDGNHNGWAAYRVADHVKKHRAWGVGVYSVFLKTKDFVLLENAIVTPLTGDIVIHYPFTVHLSNNGGIEHIINGFGGPHTSKESRRGSILTLPGSFKNVWRADGQRNTVTERSGFIKTSGSKFVDGNGNEYIFKGMGFWGGNGATAPNSFQERDYKNMADIGFNSIRLYLGANFFENTSTNPVSYKEETWAWLDQRIEWAKKHNLTLVLNFHYTPGARSISDKGLFAEMERQDRLVALWREVARRYAHEPVISAYDIVNEPTANIVEGDSRENKFSQTFAQWERLSNRIVKAIRETDMNHVIMIERLWIGNLSNPNDQQDQWQNFNGKFNFPDIDDPAGNYAYTYHCYEPGRYVHQTAGSKTDGTDRVYPSDLIAKHEGNWRMNKEFVEHAYTIPLDYIRNVKKVPAYIGELGIHAENFEANSKGVNRGGRYWLLDCMDVLGKHGISFSYHPYYESEIRPAVYPAFEATLREAFGTVK